MPNEKIEITNAHKFIQWLWEKYILHGDPFLIWWKERGGKDFYEWAMSQGITYTKCKTCGDNLHECHCKE